MATSSRLLPPPELQAALRAVTEGLAAELGCPTRACPAWSELQWTLVKAVAAMHGVSPLLSRALLWRGPGHWHEFLDQQRQHTERRHARVLSLLARLHEACRCSGIAIVALKGSALHAIEVYRAGERPMADIDILVGIEDTAAMVSILESLEFEETCWSWKERVFSPKGGRVVAVLGEHTDNPIKVELHDRVCEKLAERITDLTAEILPLIRPPGINAYPSMMALMLHLLLHAAGAMSSKAVRLVQLHDLALLSARLTPADWAAIHERVVEQRLWWVLPPLQLTSRYYSVSVPMHVLGAMRRACPRHLKRISSLQTLTDVSFSYIWVDAFPALAWTRSLPRMASYMARRLRPSAENAALRQNNLKNQAWAASGAWSTLSQSRRALRWVISRQTRPVSLHAVQAALALAPSIGS